MAGIYSQGGSAGHRYAGWLSEVEAKNFQFGGKVFNGSPSAIYVGSKMVWMLGWLEKAAKQAIMDAFLDDGTAVINATNAYLTQLAASGQAGKDKATALAGFINEDPMMVCSLGLEVEGVTMPWRYIQNDGKACIETDIYPVAEDELEAWFFNLQGSYAIFVDNGYTYFGVSSNTLYARHGNINSSTNSVSWTAGINHLIYKTNQEAKLNNNNINVNEGNNWNTGWHYHFIMRPDWTSPTGGRPVKAIIRGNEIMPFRLKEARTAAQCCPQKACSAGTLGMINVNTGIFFPNANTAGSFVEGFALPDGTPWTPSTP